MRARIEHAATIGVLAALGAIDVYCLTWIAIREYQAWISPIPLWWQ